MKSTPSRFIAYSRRVLFDLSDGYTPPKQVFPARDVEDAFALPPARKFHPHTALGRASMTAVVIPDAINNVIGGSPSDMKQIRPLVQTVLMRARGDDRVTPKPGLVDAYIAGFFPQMFVSAYYVLAEARRRMGASWRPQRILEVGPGPATGIVALNEVFKDSKSWQPQVVECVVDGEMLMARRGMELLAAQKIDQTVSTETENLDEIESDKPKEEEQDTGRRYKPKFVLNRLPSASRFDLVIVSHRLLHPSEKGPGKSDAIVKELLDLVAPEGLLVLVERGSPVGFDRIARARELIVRPVGDKTTADSDKFNELYHPNPPEKSFSKRGFRIIAPCSHHRHCPMQPTFKNEVRARSHFCSFPQLMMRPSWLLDLKRGKQLSMAWSWSGTSRKPGNMLQGKGRVGDRNTETTKTSYLIVQKRNDAEASLHSGLSDSVNEASLFWPRIVSGPLKRDGHAILEVCAPTGFVERWTVTQHANKQAYHDARKSRWGDLWALDAKRKVPVKCTASPVIDTKSEVKDDDFFPQMKNMSSTEIEHFRSLYQV